MDLGLCIVNTLCHLCWQVGIHFYYFFPYGKPIIPNSTEHTDPNAIRYFYFLFWVKITQIFILTHFANQEDELLKGSDGSLQVNILLSSHRVPSFCSQMANLAHSTAQPRFIAFLQYPGPENPRPLLSSWARGNTCAVKQSSLPSAAGSRRGRFISRGHSQGRHITHRTTPPHPQRCIY